MGKYLLIEFDDDATADTLRAKIDTASAKGKRYRVIGEYKKPPKNRCTCEVFQGSQTRAPDDMRRRRHRVWGFWYCARCKKVAPGPQQPTNLLGPPEGFRHGPFITEAYN
jgi:hypothetical protein